MKLKDCREAYYFFSGKASDIVRQIGFAGVALVWVFKSDIDGVPHVPQKLYFPAMLIVIALGLDFLHYISATLIWGVYSRHKEKKLQKGGGSLDEEFNAPSPLNWPALILFWAKSLVMATAYVFIIGYLASHVA